MGTYQRPIVEPRGFYDESGALIPYGSRYWGIDEEPPESAYSQCRHPERFLDVTIVASALLDHLEATYEVTRTQTQQDARRVVELRPRGDGASVVVTVATSGVPEVELRAGHRFEASWPDCGCDACDVAVPELLDDLESTLLTIAEGGLSEWRSGPDPSSPLVTDDAGRPVGNDVVPWHVHARLEGRVEHESSRWGADEPEPVDLPWTPHRWPVWPLRPQA